MIDRAKILDKIEKCMRLSKSSEPHEAAAALRQAQKLMEANGITEDDLKALGFTGESVQVPIQATKKLPAALKVLVDLIEDAFGVRPVFGTEVRVSDTSFVVHYFGPAARVQMATYTHTVLFRAMNRAWTEHLKVNPWMKSERGARAGFQLGWLRTVEAQVQALRMTEEEKAGTDIVVKQRFPDLVKGKVNNMKISGRTYREGQDAAEGFKLHRPMGGAEDRLKIGR